MENQDNKVDAFNLLEKEPNYSTYINGKFTDKVCINSKHLNL